MLEAAELLARVQNLYRVGCVLIVLETSNFEKADPLRRVEISLSSSRTMNYERMEVCLFVS